MKYTLCIGVTPAVQELREFKKLTLGEVNRSPAIHRTVAGKGANVARVLRQVGGKPLLLGFVGSDFITDNLRREGVPERMVRTKAPTRVCTTLMDHATGTITELVEEAALPTASEWRQFFATFRRCLPQARYVVIAGALMPGASPESYRKIAKCDVPVIIDSQRAPLLGVLEYRPFIVKLNVHELKNTLGRVDVAAGAWELLKRGAQNVVVTDGAKGAWLVTKDMFWCYEPPKISVVNPIGSGDAMTAGIVRSLERGEDLPRAVCYGVACGAANALTLIAGTVKLPDVERFIRHAKFRDLKNL
jgi:1-phosphofructokinase family hexose kinase